MVRTLQLKGLSLDCEASSFGSLCFQVKRYSYSTATENSTYPVKRLWSLQRNCTNKCESGCIVIGERTKLHVCTACCEKFICNTMNDGAPRHRHSISVVVLGVLVVTALTS
jgi:hypothetical protein